MMQTRPEAHALQRLTLHPLTQLPTYQDALK
jgi:hypothetical protein